ncbi:hypothetical protein [Vulcanisaeta thermophila]|uniref:hypothetical protein n=1 Tax=Vulcanisaeta thermophila TaxID=867917 RepID=UPI000853AFF3|nr:hypothetical protein [Vulcanisaeta thermophila]
MSITAYTSDGELTKALSNGFRVSLNCDLAQWAWGAHELLMLVDEAIEKCPGDPVLRYLWVNYRLRIERNIKNIAQLKNEEQTLRRYLREACGDTLVCLANRIYRYDQALKAIINYYRLLDRLSVLDIAKLSLAAYRYGLVSMGIELLKVLVRMGSYDLVHLAFISMLNPRYWPLHITVDANLLKILNWVLLLFNGHYIIMMNSLEHNYVVSDLNINVNGSRLVNDNYYEFLSIGDHYVNYHVVSETGHGVLFIGNWGDEPVNVSPDLVINEGSVKGRFIDADIRQWAPGLVLPHDYVSIKY